VLLSEFVAIHRADELLELVERLLAQVVPVHEEENAPGIGVLDEPVAEVDGGESLAAAGRHLHQRTKAVGGERLIEVLDALDLYLPQMADVQRRHLSKMRPHLLVELDEADQFFGPVEGEDVPAASVRLQGVRELRDLAGGL